MTALGLMKHTAVLRTQQQCSVTSLPGAKFDAVTALEVIEHVNNQPAFCGSLAALTADWGAVLVSTLSRTPQVNPRPSTGPGAVLVFTAR